MRRRSQSDFVKEQIYNEHFFGFGLANVISFSGIRGSSSLSICIKWSCHDAFGREVWTGDDHYEITIYIQH
jgi:hypothetical protein